MPGITHVGLIVCAALLASPARADAQGIATTLHELRLLVRAGETVTVTDSIGRETKGRIESLSAGQIVLRTPDGLRQWSDPDLRVIRQRRGEGETPSPSSARAALGERALPSRRRGRWASARGSRAG